MSPSDKDIYTKQLSKLKHGGPLFQPSDVRLGDVGFMTIQGGFRKLYNIAYPPAGPGDRFNRRPQAVDVEMTKVSRRETWGPVGCSKSKGWGLDAHADVSVGQIKFSFSQVQSGQCILIPGDIVELEELQETRKLSDYMKQHIGWIIQHFTSIDFDPKSVVLVVRTVKTNRWSILVNSSSETIQDLTFSASSVAGASSWGNWSATASMSRSGPADGTVAADRSPDQTLFIGRIALRPPVSYFGNKTFLPTIEPTRMDRFLAIFPKKRQRWFDEAECDDSDSKDEHELS